MSNKKQISKSQSPGVSQSKQSEHSNKHFVGLFRIRYCLFVFIADYFVKIALLLVNFVFIVECELRPWNYYSYYSRLVNVTFG